MLLLVIGLLPYTKVVDNLDAKYEVGVLYNNHLFVQIYFYIYEKVARQIINTLQNADHKYIESMWLIVMEFSSCFSM